MLNRIYLIHAHVESRTAIFEADNCNWSFFMEGTDFELQNGFSIRGCTFWENHQWKLWLFLAKFIYSILNFLQYDLSSSLIRSLQEDALDILSNWSNYKSFRYFWFRDKWDRIESKGKVKNIKPIYMICYDYGCFNFTDWLGLCNLIYHLYYGNGDIGDKCIRYCPSRCFKLLLELQDYSYPDQEH